MSVRNDIPFGYKSVQDYILHLAGNYGRKTSTKTNNSNQIEKPKLQDSGDDFKKENFLRVKHQPVRPSDQGSNNNARLFYERTQNSDVHPTQLMNPEDIDFQPI